MVDHPTQSSFLYYICDVYLLESGQLFHEDLIVAAGMKQHRNALGTVTESRYFKNNI